MSESDSDDLSSEYFTTETNVQKNVNMYCLESIEIKTAPSLDDILTTFKKPHCILSKLTSCTTFRDCMFTTFAIQRALETTMWLNTKHHCL